MAITKQKNAVLRAGQRLSREEFLRRWEAHPEVKRAELIGGIVYMPSPVSAKHGFKESNVGTWLGHYKAWTPGTESAHSATTLLLEDAPQPDLSLVVLPEYGGLTRWEGEYLGGTLDFLAEISRSTASHDLGRKLRLYQSARIPEYMVVIVSRNEIRWHVLDKGKYHLLSPDAAGIWRSRVFPGLWLDGNALLDGNLAQVLTKLDEGLATPEHQAFVEKLKAARRA